MAINLNKFICTYIPKMSFLNISRKLSITSCLMGRRLIKRANPGLGHQISAIEDAADAIRSDPEGFGELESDLFNAHKSHKKHELDIKRQSEEIRLRIVKNKYFRKDPLPNLLTYAEKEHIKFLHSSDAEEWTVEKLADSFPANAETICKILKANWSPLSSKRIQIHDTNVLKNWERFKNGEYKENIPAQLSEHLEKFVDRRANCTISQNPAIPFKKKQWQRPISNEFSLIISSLRPNRIDADETTASLEAKPKSNKVRSDSIDSETYLLREIKNKKPITIHQLKSTHFVKSNQDSITYNENNTLDQWAAKKYINTSGTGIVTDKDNSSTYLNDATDYTQKFTLNEIRIDESDIKRNEMCATKQRIHIPRKLWRKGATFRAYNCYYDDDGEFLYKVPGIDLQ